MSPIRSNPNVRGLALLAKSTTDDPWTPVTDALDHALRTGEPDELSALAFVAGEMAATGAPTAAKPLLQALQLYTHRRSQPSLRDLSIEPRALLEIIAADDVPRSVLGADVQLAASELAKSLKQDDLVLALIRTALQTYRRRRDTLGSAIAHHALADVLSERREGLAAMHEYRAAAERYTRAGDQNGQAATLINAISAALEVGDHIGSIRDSERLATLTLRDPHLRASSLRSQARVLISIGREQEARPLLLGALRSCRRRFDPDLEVVVLQDLAILTGATSGHRQASHWWVQANAKCAEYGLVHRQMSLAHGLALNQYESGDLATAILTLEDAMSLSDDQDITARALAEADLGAMQLEAALQDGQDVDEAERTRELAAISSRLIKGLGHFIANGQIDDAERALRNFVVLCQLSDDGCDQFDQAFALVALEPSPDAQSRLMDTLSIAGILCGRQSRLGTEGTSDPEDADSRALRLAEAAVEAHEEWGNDDGALRLFDAAAAHLLDSPTSNSYGDILNSRGLLLAEIDREDEALDSLRNALGALRTSGGGHGVRPPAARSMRRR